MNIRRYRDGADYPLIESWYKGWKMPVMAESYFSSYGIIVDGIVAAWLYQTDSKLCLIENTISDPTSDRAHRRDCIVAAYKELFKEASRLGFLVCMGYTDVERIANDSARFGTNRINKPIYLLVKNLKET